MRDAVLPIFLIVMGILWLLFALNWIPDLDWLIGLGFIAAGIGVMLTDGINKQSIVSGPFLISLGIAWFLRLQYGAQYNYIVPILLIVLGLLMLLARLPQIPEPRAPKKLASPEQS